MSAVVAHCLHHLLIHRRLHIAAISTLSLHSPPPPRNYCTWRFTSSIPLHSRQHSTSTQDDIRGLEEVNEKDGAIMEPINVNPSRGTRDFTPEDMRLRNWLFHNFREVSRLLSFEEVDFPDLESEALFIRKAG